MGETAIEVRGLRKSFGTKEAVAGIDLEIAAGSLAGLVGPNGAGKTTSLSMMTGLLRPDAGQILINGLDVWADPQGRNRATAWRCCTECRRDLWALGVSQPAQEGRAMM
jgi:ABC-type multidrug transport system ATPase subunit